MKFCRNCGVQMDDSAVFCADCGTPVAEAAQTAAPQPEQQAQPQPVQSVPQPEQQPLPVQSTPQQAPYVQPKVKKEKKPLPKWFLPAVIGGGAVLVAAIVLIIILVTAPKKIDLNQYVSINYDGYNGYATAYYDLDRSLQSDLQETLGIKDDLSNLGNILESAEKSANLYAAVSSIRVELDKSEKISNGDVITATISYDNELANKVGIQFVGESVTATVEGLEEIHKVDPFDGFVISFSGTAPDGRADYSYEGTESISYYDYEVSPTKGLSNGDTITVTMSKSESDTVRNGYIYTENSKTYTVAGLDSYVASAAELPDGYFDTLKNESEDYIKSYVAKSWNTNSSISDLQYVGYCFLCSDEAYWGDTNMLYIIYSATASNSEGKFMTQKIYFPVKYSDILLCDGVISNIDSDGILSSSYFGDSSYYSKGYTNPKLCYDQIYTSNLSSYANVTYDDGFDALQNDISVSSIDEIDETLLASLKEEKKDAVVSYVLNCSSNNEVAEPVYLGCYYLNAKIPGPDLYKNNRLYLLYQVEVKNGRNTKTLFYAFGCSGFTNYPDGQQGYVDERIYGNYYWPYGYTFEDIDTMYRDLITSNLDTCTYEIVSENGDSLGE